MKSRVSRPAFAAGWLFWAQLSSVEQCMGDHGCSISTCLCRANQSKFKPLKVAELFSVLSYQRTCSFCGFIGRTELMMPCAWQGAKYLCLGTVTLYFSLYGGHARNCVSQDLYRDQLFCLLDWLFSLSAHSENATEIVTGFQWGVIQIPVLWAYKTEQIWAFAFFQNRTQKLLSGAFIRIM